MQTEQNTQSVPANVNVMQVIKTTPVSELASLPVLQHRFIDLYEKTKGVSPQEAAMVFETEKYHFQKAISENATLRECEALSLYGCFMDCAVQGLSFDPKAKLAYIIPSNVNMGTRDNPKWTKRANLEISPYGELAIRQMTGQIKHADNPVIVYKGDKFEPGENASGKNIEYKLNPEHSNEIIAAFIKIVRVDGTVDYHWLLRTDWERLATYSKKKNKSQKNPDGVANALYTSFNGGIDPGFLAAKMIKHAFKSYPKVNLIGRFSKVQQDPEEHNPSEEEIYGFAVEEDPKALPAAEVQNAAQPASNAAKAAVLNATAPEQEETGTVQHFDDSDGGF